jgi:HAD superfamily hydrolase (TIGR01490 family)
MALALFDLDKTLIVGDSDYLWGEFLVEKGLVDKNTYQQTNQAFFDDYARGKLNMDKYLEFCLKPLTQHSLDKLLELRREFVLTKIKPQIYAKGVEIINKHKQDGDFILVISATNEFIVAGVLELFTFDDFLATNAEFKNNKYTGKSIGTPCFQDGKVVNLNNWLKIHNFDLKNSYFYSDSFNDLPLLKIVDNPIATNPDDKLKNIALQNDWQIEYW